MAERRTTSEINKDYKLCKKYVDEHPTITSLKEVAETVGLSESQVKTSLSQHPRVFNKIQKLIVCNQETLKAQKAAEVEAKQKAEMELINVQKNNKKLRWSKYPKMPIL